MSRNTRLKDLSLDITQNIEIIDNFMKLNQLPYPSLAAEGPLSFPVGPGYAQIHVARRVAMDASKTLYDLLWSPEERALHQFTTVPADHH